jgi:hypothetical protein
MAMERGDYFLMWKKKRLKCFTAGMLVQLQSNIAAVGLNEH